MVIENKKDFQADSSFNRISFLKFIWGFTFMFRVLTQGLRNAILLIPKILILATFELFGHLKIEQNSKDMCECFEIKKMLP